MIMISISITIQITTLGNRSYLFPSDRLPLKSMEQSLSMDKIELSHTLGNSAPIFYLFSKILFLLDFEKLYFFPQLHRQNTFQHLIKNLLLIYKQCREEHTIKKYQQYLKTWKEQATENQVCFLPGEPVHVAL